MRPHARVAGQPEDALYGEVLALLGARLEEMHVAPKLVGPQVSLAPERFVDRAGELGVHEQGNAGASEVRHGAAKVAVADLREVVNA